VGKRTAGERQKIDCFVAHFILTGVSVDHLLQFLLFLFFFFSKISQKASTLS
jgi:hypothetical protein